MSVIGLDLGGTKLKGAIFTEHAEIVYKGERKLETQNGRGRRKADTGLCKRYVETGRRPWRSDRRGRDMRARYFLSGQRHGMGVPTYPDGRIIRLRPKYRKCAKRT